MSSDVAPPSQRTLVMGFEGSANKIGIGIIDQDGNILANVRHTYISPPGTGFMPRETAQHHQAWILPLIKQALQQANVTSKEIAALAYTKGLSFVIIFERSNLLCT